MARIVERFGLTRYDADQHYKEALQAYKKRNLEEAHVHINQAIQLLSSHAEYYAAQGFFYLEDDVTAKAQASFDTVLSLNPYEMLANYGKGIIAYKDKNWEEALAYFFDALAAEPNRPETQYYLAMVNHRLSQNDQALKWMQQARMGFAKTEDKRERNCERWLREFEKLVEEGLLRFNPGNPDADPIS